MRAVPRARRDLPGHRSAPRRRARRTTWTSATMEYPHHGDALVPRQQRFGGYTRSLMKGLGIPVENRYGLRPAVTPETKQIAPLSIARDLDTAAGSTGVDQLQLPHAPAALRGDDRRPRTPSTCWPGSRSTCRGRIRSPKRATRSSTRSSGCRPSGDRAGDVLVADSTIFSTLFGGDESLERFWKNIATASDDMTHSRARARRHPERRPAPAADSVRGDLHPVPHRRPRRRAGADAARLSAVVASAADPTSPAARHLGQRRAHLPGPQGAGVPQDSLDSFAWEFRQGMAARADSAGRHRREQPRALGDAARDAGRPRRARRRSRPTARGSRRRSTRPPGLRGAARGRRRSGARTATRCPPRREPFGFRDGISHPAIEGSGIPGTNPLRAAAQGRRVRARLPRRDRRHPPMPQPEVLGRNGTYVVFRKLHQRVAAFRRYLKDERRRAPRTRSCWRRR